MVVSLVVAVADNNVIGFKNRLPWEKIKADMRWFREVTMGKPVIMGRKTFQSIGRPLSGRLNIVMTTSRLWIHEGCEVVNNMQEAKNLISELEKNGDKEVCVIGGESIYSQFLPMANKIYLTKIRASFKGDAFFKINYEQWEQHLCKPHKKGEDSPYDLEFYIFQKKEDAYNEEVVQRILFCF